MATGTATSTRSIVGCVKINNKSYVTDIRYVDIDIIVLTKDNLVTDSNRLLINGQQYQIQTIIPAYTNRGYTQLLCKAIQYMQIKVDKKELAGLDHINECIDKALA